MEKNELFLEQMNRVDEKLDRLLISSAKAEIIIDTHAETLNKIEEDLKPIKNHVNSVNTLVKGFAFFGTITLVIGGIVKIAEAFIR